MGAKIPGIETLLSEALEIPTAEGRAAYLDRACGGDEERRRQVESLLAAHAQAGGFLASPAARGTATWDGPPRSEGPGTSIGAYRLMEPIGEGGMGIVYVAEQRAPVRREVALKVIKPGMDSQQVVARFEAERQALAMMDHPNIAKVHDAGATDSGRPYFVMELVCGIPITDDCDQARLSIPERLELFVSVCRAVQHAHQKGVIHRDLKPSNILVTLVDGAAVPKVIDFGVAKATGASLTERTLFTGLHRIIGTPLYMSPEQADLSGAGVDTRSDIYALGVLLYELLTGTTPFDREAFGKAAFEEMRRIIREDEPPKPSTRLSSLGERLLTVSASRKADPRRLGPSLRGELDWAVMKAMEKDRRRRYETVNDFAADVMNFLSDRPVEAFPPSAWYRFTKNARRNRAAMTTAGLVAIALIAGTAAITLQAMRATKAEGQAGQRAEDTELVVASFFNDVIGAAAPAEARGQPIRVVELLGSAGRTLHTRFRGRPIAEAAFHRALAEAYGDLGHFVEAEQQICQAVELRTELLGPEHPETLRALAYQVRVLRGLGAGHQEKQEEVIQLGRRVVEAQHRLLGPNHRESLVTLCELGQAHLLHGDFRQARDILESTLGARVRMLGMDAPETLETQHALGRTYHGLGHLDMAETLLRRAVDAQWRAFGMQDPGTLSTLNSLGLVLQDRGRADEAVSLFREVIAGMRAFHGSRYFGGNRYLCGELVDALRDRGDSAAVRETCEGWPREILEMPPEPDPLVRQLKMVSLSCTAFWLAALPPGNPFDGELAVRAAEQAAKQGDNTRDSNWTRLSLVHLRLGHPERAEWALRESMAHHDGGNRFDWLVQELIHARRGEVGQARASFDRAVRGDDGDIGPGVGNVQVRSEVAALLSMAPGSDAGRLNGPAEIRNEGSPLPRGTLSRVKAEPKSSPESRRISRQKEAKACWVVQRTGSSWGWPATSATTGSEQSGPSRRTSKSAVPRATLTESQKVSGIGKAVKSRSPYWSLTPFLLRVVPASITVQKANWFPFMVLR